MAFLRLIALLLTLATALAPPARAAGDDLRKLVDALAVGRRVRQVQRDRRGRRGAGRERRGRGGPCLESPGRGQPLSAQVKQVGRGRARCRRQEDRRRSVVGQDDRRGRPVRREAHPGEQRAARGGPDGHRPAHPRRQGSRRPPQGGQRHLPVAQPVLDRRTRRRHQVRERSGHSHPVRAGARRVGAGRRQGPDPGNGPRRDPGPRRARGPGIAGLSRRGRERFRRPCEGSGHQGRARYPSRSRHVVGRTERLVWHFARLGPAARRHRARHHVRRDGRHQHGAWRDGDAGRLHDLCRAAIDGRVDARPRRVLAGRRRAARLPGGGRGRHRHRARHHPLPLWPPAGNAARHLGPVADPAAGGALDLRPDQPRRGDARRGSPARSSSAT